MANFTLPGNDTRMFEYFQYANTVTSGQFGVWILIAIYFIILIGSKQFSDPRAHAIASWVTAFAAILLSRAGVVGYYPLTISLIAALVMFVWVFFANKQPNV